MFQNNNRLNALSFLLAAVIAILAAVSSFAQTPTYPPKEGEPTKGGAGFLGVTPSWFVLVKTRESPLSSFMGSGCFIAQDLVLSCGHNVREVRKGRETLSVQSYDGTLYNDVEILRYDADLDLSLLKINGVKSGHTHSTLKLGQSLSPGDTVWSVGWVPKTSVCDMFKGQVTDKKGGKVVNGSFSHLYDNHTATVVQGMSGGPLLDTEQNIVGVNISADFKNKQYTSTRVELIIDFLK